MMNYFLCHEDYNEKRYVYKKPFICKAFDLVYGSIYVKMNIRNFTLDLSIILTFLEILLLTLYLC